MTNKKSLMEIHLTSVDVFLACSQQLAQPVHRRRVAIDNGKLLFKHPPTHTLGYRVSQFLPRLSVCIDPCPGHLCGTGQKYPYPL